MSILGIIPDSVIDTLKADGIAIEHWVVSEAHKVASFLLQDKGFVGIVANAIATLESHDLTGDEKMKLVVRTAVPLAVQLITAGKSAVPVIETDIFQVVRAAAQIVFTDGKQLPSIGGIVNALGL